MKSSTIANLAKLSITAVLIYQGILLAGIFIRPDLDPSWHTISEWAIGRYGWMMSAGFMISSVSYCALSLWLKNQTKGIAGYIGLGILAICVVGTFGVGLFTTDPLTTAPENLSSIGMAHFISGGSALFLFPLAALLISLSMRAKNTAWASARPTLLWLAFVPLFGLMGFMTYHTLYVVPLGSTAYGPGVHIGWPPRFALFCYMIWLVVFNRTAIKLSR
jgi:hypothetical protein